MSSPSATPYKDWWQKVVGSAIPWLAGGTNGQAEGNAWPALLDYLLTLLLTARYCAYPNKCPDDALPHLGGDRGLIQGPAESNSNFRTRIQTAWGNSPITINTPRLPATQSGGPTSGWALAGTPLQLLEEIYWWVGSGEAVWVQQNGVAFKLSGTPTPGADNSGLLVRHACSALPDILTSSLNPPTVYQAGRSIPAGNGWWLFDDNTDFCSRFAIVFPTAPASYPWSGLLLSQLQKIIATWRPNQICVGVFVCTSGQFFQTPMQSYTFGSSAQATFGPSTVVQVLSQF